MNMEEIWKDIKGYEQLYRISNLGNVFSVKLKREIGFIVPKTENYKTKYVILTKDGNKKRVAVHRLVAETFISNPNKLPQVDHVDTDPLNNRVENLRWVSAYENSNNPLTKVHQKEAAKERCKIYGSPTEGKESVNRVKVLQYTLEGVFIKEWDCIQEISKELKLDNGSISKCINNKRKSCGGYLWLKKL